MSWRTRGLHALMTMLHNDSLILTFGLCRLKSGTWIDLQEIHFQAVLDLHHLTLHSGLAMVRLHLS